MDDLEGTGEGHHAGDACFCCHESEEATWLWKSGPHLKQVGFLLVILANTIKQTPTFRLETWEFVFSLEHRYIGAFSFSDLI